MLVIVTDIALLDRAVFSRFRFLAAVFRVRQTSSAKSSEPVVFWIEHREPLPHLSPIARNTMNVHGEGIQGRCTRETHLRADVLHPVRSVRYHKSIAPSHTRTCFCLAGDGTEWGGGEARARPRPSARSKWLGELEVRGEPTRWLDWRRGERASATHRRLAGPLEEYGRTRFDFSNTRELSISPDNESKDPLSRAMTRRRDDATSGGYLFLFVNRGG